MNIIPKLELINTETGESIPMDTVTARRPKRLKMNIWVEAYDFVIEKTVKSPLDFKILSHIKKNVNAENQFMGSLPEIAKATGTSKDKMSKFIKKLVEVGFLHRIRTSVYMINPYVFVGNGVWNVGRNRGVIACQDKWKQISIEPPITSDLWLVNSLTSTQPK